MSRFNLISNKSIIAHSIFIDTIVVALKKCFRLEWISKVLARQRAKTFAYNRLCTIKILRQECGSALLLLRCIYMSTGLYLPGQILKMV